MCNMVIRHLYNLQSDHLAKSSTYRSGMILASQGTFRKVGEMVDILVVKFAGEGVRGRKDLL